MISYVVVVTAEIKTQKIELEMKKEVPQYKIYDCHVCLINEQLLLTDIKSIQYLPLPETAVMAPPA